MTLRLNHQQPVVGRLQKEISLENLARTSFFNSVMYTFTFSGELWVAHTGREPSEFRGSKVKIAEVKMKVAILIWKDYTSRLLTALMMKTNLLVALM